MDLSSPGPAKKADGESKAVKLPESDPRLLSFAKFAGHGGDVKWHVICCESARALSRIDFWVASRGEAMATD